jgi:hypothetical protein
VHYLLGELLSACKFILVLLAEAAMSSKVSKETLYECVQAVLSASKDKPRKFQVEIGSSNTI